MIRCPKCNYFKVATERRPDGNSKCIACQYEAPTKEFEVKNWDWIDQETQTQLDKLKSLMSVQLDMLEQNKQMSSEIDQLKSKLKVAVENFEKMNTPQKVYDSHRDYFHEVNRLNLIAKQALSEIGETK